MRRGRKMRGNIPARRTTGRAWRWIQRAASSTFPQVRPPPISTARTASATTCFANTLLALKADTGERIWHFQAVKHDLWDRDFPSPPTLVTVKRGGKSIDAVAQATKQGWLYLFDRTNGQPLFPIEYKKYPASTVPGEVTSETQPLPTKPAPFARQLLTADMLTNRTPEAHQWAVEQFAKLQSAGQFVPLKVGQETVVFPGFDGGAEWGGSAFDPETGIYYVNANDLAWTSSLNPAPPARGAQTAQQLYSANCAGCHREDLSGQPPQFPSLLDIRGKRTEQQVVAMIRQGGGRMASFPNLSAVGRDARSRNMC